MPFIGNIGPGELILLLIIILVIFGPGRLPEIGQAVGKGIREFRKASSDVAEATRLEPTPPPAPPAATAPPAGTEIQPPNPPPAPAASLPAPLAPDAVPPAESSLAEESDGDASPPTA
jgi:sec-independent protein translocase protein TatA